MMIPRFDIWFWLLVIWALVVPYLFDHAHMRSCEESGRITLRPLPAIFSEAKTYSCTPMPMGEHIPAPAREDK